MELPTIIKVTEIPHLRNRNTSFTISGNTYSYTYKYQLTEG